MDKEKLYKISKYASRIALKKTGKFYKNIDYVFFCKNCGKKVIKHLSLSRFIKKLPKFCSLGCYYNSSFLKFNNPNFQRRMGKKAKGYGAKVVLEKYGCWGINILKEKDPKKYYQIKKRQIKKALKTQRKNKTGFFNPKHQIQQLGGYASQKTLKKKGLGFYNPQTTKRAMESRRQNYPFWFLGVPFDSDIERKVAKQLFLNLFFIPKERVNCHIKLNGGEFDFFIWNQIFIEFHPWDWNGNSIKKYYKKRRRILDKNGYREYPLITIDSIDKLKTFISYMKGGFKYGFSLSKM